MILTREQLTTLIVEQLRESKTALLEMPMADGPGAAMGAHDNMPHKNSNACACGEEDAKQKLYHMAAQASQLEAILLSDDNLTPEVQEKIESASRDLNAAFRSIMADKRPGSGMMKE